jgi:hypothetical protein
MTRRFLLETFKEGHFVALHERKADTQQGLKCIGTWMKGFQKSSDRFSATSLSLS